MSDGERKFIEFHFQEAEMAEAIMSPGRCIVKVQFIGHLEDSIDWISLQKRLGEGFKIYETETIVHEALAAVQADLEKEKQRHQDLERDLQARITELEARVSHEQRRAQIAMEENQRLVPENIRLRGLEAALESLSGLGVHKVVR